MRESLLPAAAADLSVGEAAPSESHFTVLNPATEQPIASVADHDAHYALEQISRATSAGATWAATTPRHRADIMHNVYDLLLDNRDRLARVITREMGKTLKEAAGEVQYSADYVRWYAEELVRPGGSYRDNPHGGSTILTKRSPVGLAVLISPWNFPMAMITRKIAPAIASGSPAIAKPASLTPLTTLLTVELMVQAGVPEELVRVVTTTRSSEFSTTVLNDSRVRKLSFTGSTQVGSTLLGLASKNIIKSSMELGGNAPFIVFDDADLERAIAGAVAAKLRNGGQSCIAANRFYVQEGIADDFLQGFSEQMGAISLGPGDEESTQLGPMIDRGEVQRLQGVVDDAVAKGAIIRAGGSAPEGPGYFFEATVLENVAADSQAFQNEIFGPIAPVRRFSTQSEVLEAANDTPFGLAGYVFSENLDRALNVADALETGLVGINQGVPSNAAAPFGGLKQSGMGREGSAEGLEEYQEVRFYNIARRDTH